MNRAVPVTCKRKEGDMADVVSDVTDDELAQAVKDLAFEGYAIIEMKKGPNGLWTIAIRKNAANGAPQSADDDDAIQSVAVAPQNPKPGATLKLGPDGARLIKAFESCAKSIGGDNFRAYLDSVKVPTIGWGHTNHLGRQFDMTDIWTQQECDAEFESDMRVFERNVLRLVKIPLNQLQFDALVSFCYNCGQGNFASSTLLKRVNEGDFPAAAQQFGRWVKAKGQTLGGLVRRRKYEARLFLGAHDMTYP
jgi:lysozyme